MLFLLLIITTCLFNFANALPHPMHMLALDGTTYLSLLQNSTSLLTSLDQSFSVELWIRPSHLKHQLKLAPERRAFVAALTDVGKVDGGAHITNVHGWWLGLDRQNRLSFGCSTNGKQHTWNKQIETVVHSSIKLTSEQWYYIVATYDAESGLGKIYSNGKPAGSRLLGKGGVSYGDIGDDDRDLPSVVALRYKDRNVDQRMAATIGGIAFWRVALKAPAIAKAAQSIKSRDQVLVQEATRAIPSTKLISFFRFDIGHGNSIKAYGYTRAFLDGNNPEFTVIGPTVPVWIADSADPPAPLPKPLPKATSRGANNAKSNQTASRIADVATEALALDGKRQAALAIPNVIAAKAKRTSAEMVAEAARRDASKTADQLDTARAYEAVHRDPTKDKDDIDGGLSIIVKDIAQIHHASKVAKLVAARKKADKAVLVHRHAAEVQMSIAVTARALADGYSILHDLSRDIQKLTTTTTTPTMTDHQQTTSLKEIQERLSLGVHEIQREMRGTEKERSRTWKRCKQQGTSAHELAGKTVRTLRDAKRTQKTIEINYQKISKKQNDNKRTIVTLNNLGIHIDEQMKAARIISARATTKHGSNNERLAKHLLKRLDTDLSNIEDDATKKNLNNDDKYSPNGKNGKGWLDTILWTSFLQASESKIKTLNGKNKNNKNDPYSRHATPLRNDYVDIPAESVDPATNYSAALDSDTSTLKAAFDFPLANQKPKDIDVPVSVEPKDTKDQDGQESQKGQKDQKDQDDQESETNESDSSSSSSLTPYQTRVTTDPIKLKFHESWKPALQFASEIRGMLSRTAGALSNTVQPPVGSTKFTDTLGLEKQHVAQALEAAEIRKERLLDIATNTKASLERSTIHLNSLNTLLTSQKEYYNLAKVQCETKLDVFDIMSEKRSRALKGVKRVLNTIETVASSTTASTDNINSTTNSTIHLNTNSNFNSNLIIQRALEELTNMSKPLTEIRALARAPVPSLDKTKPLGGRDVGYDHTGEECAWQVQRGQSYLSIADYFGVAPSSIVNLNENVFNTKSTIYPPSKTWISIGTAPKFNKKECTWAPIGYSQIAQRKEPLSTLGFEPVSEHSKVDSITDTVISQLVATTLPSQMTKEEKNMVRDEALKEKEEKKLKQEEEELEEKELAESMLESYLNETKDATNVTSSLTDVDAVVTDSNTDSNTTHKKSIESFEQVKVPKDLPKDLKDTLVAASVLGKLRAMVENGETLTDENVAELKNTNALPKNVRDKAVRALNVAKKSMESKDKKTKNPKKTTKKKIKTNSLGVQEATDTNDDENQVEDEKIATKKSITVKMTLAINFNEISNKLGAFKSQIALDISTNLGVPGNGIEVAEVHPCMDTKSFRFKSSATADLATTTQSSFGVEIVVVIKGNSAAALSKQFVAVLNDPTSALRTSGSLSKVDVSTLVVTSGGVNEVESMSALNDLDTSMKTKINKVEQVLKKEVENDLKVVEKTKMKTIKLKEQVNEIKMKANEIEVKKMKKIEKKKENKEKTISTTETKSVVVPKGIIKTKTEIPMSSTSMKITASKPISKPTLKPSLKPTLKPTPIQKPVPTPIQKPIPSPPTPPTPPTPPSAEEQESEIMIQEMKVAADIKDARDETKIAIANKEKARTPKEKDALQIAVKSMEKLVLVKEKVAAKLETKVEKIKTEEIAKKLQKPPRFQQSKTTTTVETETKEDLAMNQKDLQEGIGFLKFTGGDYMDMGTNGYELMSSNIHNEFTISAWVRIHDISNNDKYNAIVSAVGEVEQEKRGFILGYGPHLGHPPTWLFGVRDTDGSKSNKFTYARSNVPVMKSKQGDDGDDADTLEFVHLVGICTKDTISIYINDKLAGVATRGKRETMINFDVASSTYDLKPKLYLMTYGINGNVPPPPCCVQADLSDTKIWNVALNINDLIGKENSQTDPQMPPILSLDMSAKFLTHHTMTSGSAMHFNTKGTTSKGTTGVYIKNDVASSSTIHMNKKTKIDEMEALSDGLSDKRKKQVLYDSRYTLSSNDLQLLSRVRTEIKTMNEAQIAFSLGLLLSQKGSKQNYDQAIDQHVIMTGPTINIQDIAHITTQVVESKALSEMQLRVALTELPKCTTYVSVINLLHTLLIGQIPKMKEITMEQPVVVPEGKDVMISNIKRQAEAEAALALKQKEIDLEKSSEMTLNEKRGLLSNIRKELDANMKDVQNKELNANSKMKSAVSLGKAIAQQHVQMNDWLTEQGFPPLQNLNGKQNDVGKEHDEKSTLEKRVTESAAVSISRITQDAVYSTRTIRDKACNTPTATNMKNNENNEINEEKNQKNAVQKCREATDKYEQAVEQNDAAKSKLNMVSNDLRKAVLERRGEYQSFLNETASTAAEMDQELQRMVHDESAARALANKATGSGNSEVANVYGERADELKIQMERIALKAVALRTRGQNNNDGIYASKEEGKSASSSSPLLQDVLDSSDKDPNDPQWLTFAAHNLKLETSSNIMATEVQIRKMKLTLNVCQRSLETATKDGCKKERIALNKARAALLVAQARLYSIEGVYNHGIVGTTSEREQKLSIEKDSVVQASMRMDDQRMDALDALNATQKEVKQLQHQLVNEQDQRTYADGVAQQMEKEMNATETSYVRVAIKFIKSLDVDTKESKDKFDELCIIALAEAFNTTTERIKIDGMEELKEDLMSSSNVQRRLRLRRRRRRRLSSYLRTAQDVVVKKDSSPPHVLVHVRVIADELTVDVVKKSIENALMNGELEKFLQKEGVGSGASIVGDVTTVVRERLNLRRR